MEKTSCITDLDTDSLVHCASYLSLQDLANMAMSSHVLKRASYSDSIWRNFFRTRWPQQVSSLATKTSGIREAYLARHNAILQFEFDDPLVADWYTIARNCDHIILDNYDIIFSQGSSVHVMGIDRLVGNTGSLRVLNNHKARITCMRIFPNKEIALARERQSRGNFLVTSSSDHSISISCQIIEGYIIELSPILCRVVVIVVQRMRKKNFVYQLLSLGSCLRHFRGHNGPVTTLSDKLLGINGEKVLASGGEDGTVRLWSLGSSGKRGQQALRATLYGHEKPLKLMSVSGHNTSLLVSISTDSKIRVWDTNTSSAVRSSCCVGMTSFPGAPVDMKCHESLVYIASNSSVVIVDLRTMQKVSSQASSQSKLHSFAIMPSKSLICTGNDHKAMLWDIRKNQGPVKAEPILELDGHLGPVTLLHVDSYKIVTGGSDDPDVKVWETDTGKQTNSLMCCSLQDSHLSPGCTSMAVRGSQIVTNCVNGMLRLRDFENASCHVWSSKNENYSKFWDVESNNDNDGHLI